MKCPIATVYMEMDNAPPRYEWRDCLQEECAWWDKLPQRCSVLTMAVGSRIISGELHHLNDVVHCDVQERR